MKEIILLLDSLEENHNHEENLLPHLQDNEDRRIKIAKKPNILESILLLGFTENPPPPNSIQLQNELCIREMREQLVEFIAIYKPSVLDSSVGHCQMFRQGQNWIFLQSTQIQPETFT